MVFAVSSIWIGIGFSFVFDLPAWATSVFYLHVWLQLLLSMKVQDIFHMKAVFSIHNHGERFIFQEVHMIIYNTFDHTWGKEKRSNKLVSL